MSDAGNVFPPPVPEPPAPPGAVWYEPDPFHQHRLHRVAGLATALAVLLGVVALGHVGVLATTGAAVDTSERFLAGNLSEEQWSDDILPFLASTTLAGLATLATAVVTMIWLYRIAVNHRAMGRRLTFGPGWAIGGWFLPPGLWLVPALFTREHWKAADPSSAPGSETWRSSPEPVVVWVWFVLFGPLTLAINAASGLALGGGIGGDAEDTAGNFADAGSWGYASSAVTLASAAAWLLVVRGLTSRHRRLSGEAG